MPKTLLRLLTVPVVLVAALAAATGCRFGSAHFDSTVSGRPFDPSGTVFFYLDEHDDDLVAEENPRVVTVLTWIIFDPTGDLNDLEGSDLADNSHELKLRDALSLVFDRQGDVEAGAVFKSVVVDGNETGDGRLSAKVHLAPERLGAQSTYGDVIPISSQRTTDVTVTAIDFAATPPVLSADVIITFTRAETDPGDAREGEMTGTFQAPVVSERTAEQNLALLDVADVLGLPLPPRAAAPAGGE